MNINKNDIIFLSFAFTGQDQAVIEHRMQRIYELLRDAGIKAYCNLYDDNCKDFTMPGEYIVAAIEELKECTKLLAIVASDHRSQGQLMEIGAALALGLPVLTLMNDSAKGTGYIEDSHISSETEFWHTDEDLMSLIAASLKS